MSDKKPPVIVMLDGPAAGAMAALSLAAASMKTTQVLVAMDSAEQTAPTPRTDSTIGADKFVPAWKVRKDMGQLERELAAAKAETEKLREALLYAAETFRQINEGKHDPFSFDLRSNMRSAAGLALEKTRAALAATRKDTA